MGTIPDKYDVAVSTACGALNNLLYWLSQIIGAGVMGLFLDFKGLRRRVRAFGGWIILFTIINWLATRERSR